jgi:hypothetical protein
LPVLSPRPSKESPPEGEELEETLKDALMEVSKSAFGSDMANDRNVWQQKSTISKAVRIKTGHDNRYALICGSLQNVLHSAT